MRFLASIFFIAALSYGNMASASVFFDWQCDDPASCTDPGGVFGGFVEFDNSAYSPGATFSDGTGKILDFFFQSTISGGDPGAGPWLLSGLVGANPLSDLTWTFNAAGTALTAFTTLSGNTQCASQNSGDICFATSFEALNVRGNAISVQDVGNVAFSGQWVLRQQVPEPATLALMGLGLAGIGCRRQRNKTAL